MDIERINDTAIEDARYLLLNQSTPQNITGGQPDFNAGLRAGSTDQLSIDASGNLLTTGTLGAGVSTLLGGNGNNPFTLLNLNNNVTPTTGQVGQTADLVFNLTQSINSVVSLHEAARISAYKVSDWFHASTEADVDSGLKFYTTKDGTPTLQLTIDEAGWATVASGVSTPYTFTNEIYTDYIGGKTAPESWLAYNNGDGWILGYVEEFTSTGRSYLNRIVPYGSAIGVDGFMAHNLGSGLTASHSPLTQGTNTLTKQVNQFTTVANTDDVCTLPAIVWDTMEDVTSLRITIINDGANRLKVWAKSDSLIMGSSSTTIDAGSAKEFISFDSTGWKEHTLY